MKRLKVFFAVLLTIVTLTQTRPAKAAVGALVATPVLIAGLVIGGTGVLGTTYYIHKCNQGQEGSESATLCGVAVILLGAPVVLLGLVVLDGEQEVAFHELSEAQAAKIGVTSQELETFNAEIDQANMVLNEVKEELATKKNPSAEDSQRAWSSVKDLVSPETFATMQKIASQK